MHLALEIHERGKKTRICAQIFLFIVSSGPPPPLLTLHPAVSMGSYAAEEEIQDESLTYDEACAHVSGLKLQGPQKKPIKSDRGVGDVRICDSPIRDLDECSGKVEQFCDVFPAKKDTITTGCFDNIYNLCAADKYGQLLLLSDWQSYQACLSPCSSSYYPHKTQRTATGMRHTFTSSSTSTFTGTRPLQGIASQRVVVILCVLSGAAALDWALPRSTV